MTNVKDPWIAYARPNPAARVRLFLFPHAGGSAIMYRSWGEVLAPYAETFPIELPGRGRRQREPAFRRVAPLMEALCAALSPYLDKPYALFGHSLGARLAYEFASCLAERAAPAACHLFVAASHAPFARRRRTSYDLPDWDFRAELRFIAGSAPEAQVSPGLLEALLPLLRADFELNDTYERGQFSPLGMPIDAYGGQSDPGVKYDDLVEWRSLTTRRFRVRLIPGDHFFFHQSRDALLRRICDALGAARADASEHDQDLAR
jgi:medium-chain acyl-[acyl-carrier-protein] hydrolase